MKKETDRMPDHNLLNSIIEGVPIRIFWKDREQRYLGCNRLFAKDAGFSTPDELIGKTDFDMGWRDQAELYRSDDQQVMDSGEPKLAYEEPQTTPDGNTIWLRTSKVPLHDNAGEVIGILGIYENITASKDREEQLHSDQNLFAALSRAQTLFISDAGSHDVFESLLQELLHVTQSEYGFIARVLHDEDKQPYLKTLALTNIAWNDEVRDYYDKHQAEGIELRNLNSLFGKVLTSGETIIANDAPNDPHRSGTPYGHPPLNTFLGIPVYIGSDMIGMLGVANRPEGYSNRIVQLLSPLTAVCAQLIEAYRTTLQRKTMEQQLLVSEARFKNIFNNLQDAYYLTDAEGTLILVSPSAATLMAGEVDQLIGTAVADYYVIEGERQKFLDALEKNGGMVSNFEAEIRRLDGKHIWVSSNAHYRFDKDGNVCGVEGTIRDITSHKELEEDLRLAKFVMDHAPLNISMLDADGQIHYVNKTQCETLGYSEEELLKLRIHDIDPLVSEKGWQSNWQRLKRHGKLSFETEHRRKGGESFPIEVFSNHLEFGDKAYNVAFNRDISDKQQTEAHLRHEAEFRRQLLDQAAEGIVVWRLSHSETFAEFITWNRRMRELTGYTQKEINTLGWLETMYPNDGQRELARSTMLKVLEGKVNRGRDFSIVTKAGEDRILNISSAPIRGEGDEPCVLAIIEDVTKSRQQQQLLKASQRRFQTLFDSSTDGIFILNTDGNFIDLNRTAHERLGYTKKEMLASNVRELDPPDFAARVPLRMQQIFEQGSAVFESAHYRKDGSIMPVEINARLLELDGTQVVLSIVRDITERKGLEEQLRHSQKMEAIGTLVGGIAHDFNNMLAAIQGNIYLAKKHSQNGIPTLEKLENIEKLSSRAAKMVQQLLTFARKDVVQMEVFSLNDFMIDGYKLARAAIPENIDHNTAIPDEPLYIKGDTTQLQQVIFNLLSNAVDAVAESADPKIRCSLTHFHADAAFRKEHGTAENEEYACITVKDNGSGIPPEKLDKIFEPFFTTKEVGKGTGLGLAMIYGAVQTHGGIVEVESEPGFGSTFRIYLPLSDEAEAVERAQSVPAEDGHGETILLVDDEHDVRDTTSEVLSDIGYHILTAANGEEALQLVTSQEHSIDLILSDIVMPKMGGDKLLDAVRELDADLPFILTTGYDDNILDIDFHAAHCRVVHKPFDFDALSQTIQELLKAKRD